MKQITRDEASELLRVFEVINTKVERVKNALLVHARLSNKKSFMVRYNVKTHSKSYFIED